MAQFNYNNNGTWVPAKQIYYKLAGTWTALKTIWAKVNGTWVQVFAQNPPVVTLSGLSTTTIHSGQSLPYSNGARDFVEVLVTLQAAVTGGSGPFTYQWSLVSQSGSQPGTCFLISDNSNGVDSNASLYVLANGRYGNCAGTFQCVVTDSLGHVSAPATINVFFLNP